MSFLRFSLESVSVVSPESVIISVLFGSELDDASTGVASLDSDKDRFLVDDSISTESSLTDSTVRSVRLSRCDTKLGKFRGYAMRDARVSF